jgi:hypothetical protein
LSLGLILDFAQCNSKFHPPHTNVSKTHDEVNIIIMHVHIMETKRPWHKTPMDIQQKDHDIKIEWAYGLRW